MVRWLIRKHTPAPGVPREIAMLAYAMLAQGYLSLVLGLVFIFRAAL